MATAKPQKPGSTTPAAPTSEQKESARTCLHNADKLLKEGDFTRAKEQILKAKEIDPSNPYIYAFQDRIDYFEELKKKEAAKKPPTPTPPPTPKVEAKPPTPVPQPMPKLTPPPEQSKSEPPKAPIYSITPSSGMEPSPPKAPSDTSVPAQQKHQSTPVYEEPRAAKQEADSMLMEMKKQIDELNRALMEEKKAREDISSRQMQSAVKQFRTSLEKAWVNGAPPEKEVQDLRKLASSLSISEEAEHSIVREVKLGMYSKAVKEMISKRKLLKSSSSTMEWLRKVYQISISEYLENESKFLMDLVADQFKGTLLFVTSDTETKNTLVPKLKMAGFAVVTVPNPETALEKIEKINPNLIMCEAEFPDASLSGIKFLHVLRVNSKFNFLPFILLGDVKGQQQVQQSELKPNEGLVMKPVDFDALSTMVNEKLMHFREYITSL